MQAINLHKVSHAWAARNEVAVLQHLHSVQHTQRSRAGDRAAPRVHAGPDPGTGASKSLGSKGDHTSSNSRGTDDTDVRRDAEEEARRPCGMHSQPHHLHFLPCLHHFELPAWPRGVTPLLKEDDGSDSSEVECGAMHGAHASWRDHGHQRHAPASVSSASPRLPPAVQPACLCMVMPRGGPSASQVGDTRTPLRPCPHP